MRIQRIPFTSSSALIIAPSFSTNNKLDQYYTFLFRGILLEVSIPSWTANIFIEMNELNNLGVLCYQQRLTDFWNQKNLYAI